MLREAEGVGRRVRKYRVKIGGRPRQLQALLLQKPKMAGLNGVMFDSGDGDWNACRARVSQFFNMKSDFPSSTVQVIVLCSPTGNAR